MRSPRQRASQQRTRGAASTRGRLDRAAHRSHGEAGSVWPTPLNTYNPQKARRTGCMSIGWVCALSFRGKDGVAISCCALFGRRRRLDTSAASLELMRATTGRSCFTLIMATEQRTVRMPIPRIYANNWPILQTRGSVHFSACLVLWRFHRLGLRQPASQVRKPGYALLEKGGRI